MSFGTRLHECIFAQDFQTIKVAGMDVPVKFGVQALEEIQQKYGLLSTYEKELKGLKPKKTKKGTKPVFEVVEAGVQPVTDGILAMIHCGCRERHYDLTGVTDEEIINSIELTYPALRLLVLEGFSKNFIVEEEKSAGTAEEDEEEKPFNFARVLRNGMKLGFSEEEIATMYLSKIINIFKDIDKERKEIEAQKLFEEEQKEIERMYNSQD